MWIDLGDRWAIKYNLKKRAQPWQVIDANKRRPVKSGPRAGEIADPGVVASVPTLAEAAAVLHQHATYAAVKAGAEPLAAVRDACCLLEKLLAELAEVERQTDFRWIARLVENVPAGLPTRPSDRQEGHPPAGRRLGSRRVDPALLAQFHGEIDGEEGQR